MTEVNRSDFELGIKTLLTQEFISFFDELYKAHSNEILQLYDKRRSDYEKCRTKYRRDPELTDCAQLREFYDSIGYRDEKTVKFIEGYSIPQAVQAPSIHFADIDPSNSWMFSTCLNDRHATGIQIDFDDGLIPTNLNIMIGHLNCYRVNRAKGYKESTYTISDFRSKTKNEVIERSTNSPELIIRPRAWNMKDYLFHKYSSEFVPGALVDVAIYLFHSGDVLDDDDHLFFYLPKLENEHEAELWCRIFKWIENRLNWNTGRIQCCPLIESISAYYVMNKIINNLKPHIFGVNTGGFDFFGSLAVRHENRLANPLPDRSCINYKNPILNEYLKSVAECTKRHGLVLTGGMVGSFPKGDTQEHFRQIKTYELSLGYKGYLVYPDERFPDASKAAIATLNEHHEKSDFDLVPEFRYSFQQLTNNLEVIVRYLLSCIVYKEGSFVYNDAVEDSATCEIARAQTASWMKRKMKLFAQNQNEIICDKDTIRTMLMQIADSNIKNLPVQTFEDGYFYDYLSDGTNLREYELYLSTNTIRDLVFEICEVVIFDDEQFPPLVTDYIQGTIYAKCQKVERENILRKL